jgi:hypothetical protein
MEHAVTEFLDDANCRTSRTVANGSDHYAAELLAIRNAIPKRHTRVED